MKAQKSPALVAKKSPLLAKAAFTALASVMLWSGSAGSANAAIITEVCVRVADFADSGTDDKVYATFSGISGATTREFLLNMPGVDDFNRKQRDRWSCFWQSNADGQKAIKDVGFHVALTLRFSGGDDLCISQMYSRRYQDVRDEKHVISTSQFYLNNDEGLCFGDGARAVEGNKWDFETTSTIPANERLKVVGNWKLVKQAVGASMAVEYSQNVTKSNSTTNEKSWGIAITRGVEVETTFGGGSATNSLSVTASYDESRSITDTVEHSEGKTITDTCAGIGGANASLSYFQWVVGQTDIFGSKSTLNTAASVCAVNPPGGGWKPSCRPGCFDVVKDPSANTCKTEPAYCTVLVN